MGMQDEELVAAFQQGDYAAFDSLMFRWERKIQGAIYRLTGSEEDARDLAQEAFLRAYRALKGFKGEARFSSWLYQIALNLCRDRMRRRKGKTWVSLEELTEGGEIAASHARPSALDMIEARDLSRIVADAVAALPEEQREVIILKEYEGMTFAEIATALEVPISTVKTRLYRGLGQMRRRLERDGVRGAAPVPAPTI
ncbi:MAG: sigma-70 family RNA polymerase sigma factor [Vicinamibacteria bacterium]|nr:sigma-70 family RNA polymerase sigma factor [Vicinamibacteria bacterium]